MRRMRRLGSGAAAVLLALAGAVPAWGDDEGTAAGDGAGADPAAAFDSFEVLGQSQAAAGSFFAVGDEENRLAGARVGVAKPPDVYALAAAVQRGLAAGYTYAAVLGSSAAGGAGVAPEPPPGETRGLYPSEPRESTWQGPVTAGAGGPVVDGRSEAKATPAPAGMARLELQQVSVPDQLTIGGGRVESRGAPVAAGVEGASLSVLSDVTVGSGLRIEKITSRAYGLVPVGGGEPRAAASTVVEGATVNGMPVRITHAGLEVGDQAPAASSKAEMMAQIRQALAAQNIEDILLSEASAEPQPDGIRVNAGVLRVIYRNPTFGSSNPQGFSGGGFEIGGATVSVTARPAATASSPQPEPPPEAAPAASEPPDAAPSDAPGDGAVAGGLTGPVVSGSARVGYPAGAALPAAFPATAFEPGPGQPVSGPAPPEVVVAPLRPATAVATGPDTARWTPVAFLLLGSIPLGVVLAFRLARPLPPAPPAPSRKGS